MRKLNKIGLSVCALLVFATGGCTQPQDEEAGEAAMPAADEQPADKIEQALIPLPEDLRTDAGVFEYDEDGNRIVLREGSNHVECQTLDENGFNWCYPIASAARRDYQAILSAQDLSREEVQAAMLEAEENGDVDPWQAGSMIYRTYNQGDRIQLLWVVLLPNMNSADTAMSLESQRDPSLAGMGRPWMMRDGTPGAHLMIPVNGLTESNPSDGVEPLDTKALYETDPILHATLPLPEDLRTGAQVVSYDEEGNRQVLREGTNQIECATRNAMTGFTRCGHKSLGAQTDYRAQLSAQGMSFQEVSAAVVEARESGEIPSATYGSMIYRMYEEDDRLKLLWVVYLPNATSEQLGMSTAAQRDQSLAGMGRPWMMREGTPSAHLMIPINSTELSN